MTNPNLPRYWCYGDYTGNYGTHSLAFEDAEGNTFYFSYDTLVAFQRRGERRYVHQNSWGSTTGKHLNAIDGGRKVERVTGKEFEAAFEHYFGEGASRMRRAA